MPRTRKYRKVRDEWDSVTTWNIGDNVAHKKEIYKALNQNTASEPPSADWVEVPEVDWPYKWEHVDADFQTYEGMQLRGPWIAGTYYRGDLVRHEGGAWVAIQKTTTEPGLIDPTWFLLSEFLADWYDGAALLAITGLTQIPLTRSALNVSPTSPAFTVVGGDLQALIDVDVILDCAFVWTPTIAANNGDAGLLLSAVVQSGTGTIAKDLPFGGYQTSPRPTSNPLGQSHTLGLAKLLAGDTLRINAANYPGQSGTTDLDEFSMFLSVR
jgi:hypothetical protein